MVGLKYGNISFQVRGKVTTIEKDSTSNSRCSIVIVLSSKIKPSMKQECTFLFPDCVNLDEDSYDAILEDAIFGIQLE
ncbi:hypothetical protein P8452_55567 [Trifolium repens]|nr:hypothetical protein P8452_55567 [Trifolium repens]